MTLWMGTSYSVTRKFKMVAKRSWVWSQWWNIDDQYWPRMFSCLSCLSMLSLFSRCPNSMRRADPFLPPYHNGLHCRRQTTSDRCALYAQKNRQRCSLVYTVCLCLHHLLLVVMGVLLLTWLLLGNSKANPPLALVELWPSFAVSSADLLLVLLQLLLLDFHGWSYCHIAVICLFTIFCVFFSTNSITVLLEGEWRCKQSKFFPCFCF